MMDPEIIDFYQPLENEKNLFVSNIVVCASTVTCDTDLIQNCLQEIFSKFGLIYEVQVFSVNNPTSKLPLLQAEKSGPSTADNGAFKPDCETSVAWSLDSSDIIYGLSVCKCPNPQYHTTACFFAFVKFYSKRCALNARKHLNLTHFLGLQAVKVSYAKRKKEQEKRSLYVSECFRLANHYLGFNGWSTQIRQLIRREPDPPAEPGMWACQFLCIIDLTITKHNLQATGIDMFREECPAADLVGKCSTISICRKRAVHQATQDAFTKLLLVILNNGKVYPEINTTEADSLPLILQEFDPQQLIKVNELEEEPKSEDDDEDDATLNILQQLAEEGQDFSMNLEEKVDPS